MLISILVLTTTKLVSSSGLIVRDMIRSEVAKTLAQNLLVTGRRIVTNSMRTVVAQTTAAAAARSSSQQYQQQHPESTEYLVYNWLENLFTWFQIIILWHEPTQTLLALSGLFSSFLLLTYIAPRFYATILIVIFVYNFTKVWFKHVWPEIRVAPSFEAQQESKMDVDTFSHLHPQLMTPSEFGQFVKNLMQLCGEHVEKLLELRRQKPGSFCLLSCSILSCTAFIGNKISGLNLLLFIVTSLILAPGIYLHLLPARVKRYLSKTCIVENFHKAIQDSKDQPNTTNQQSKTSPQEATKTSPPTRTLFDNLLSMAYQSATAAAATAATIKTSQGDEKHAKEYEDIREEDEEDEGEVSDADDDDADLDDDGDEEDDQHDFVIL